MHKRSLSDEARIQLIPVAKGKQHRSLNSKSRYRAVTWCEHGEVHGDSGEVVVIGISISVVRLASARTA